MGLNLRLLKGNRIFLFVYLNTWDIESLSLDLARLIIGGLVSPVNWDDLMSLLRDHLGKSRSNSSLAVVKL